MNYHLLKMGHILGFISLCLPEQLPAWYPSVAFQPLLLLLFSRSVMSDSFETPWTVAHQAPLSMGFSRQEYWRATLGLPFPSPGDLPDPGMDPTSPASLLH